MTQADIDKWDELGMFAADRLTSVVFTPAEIETIHDFIILGKNELELELARRAAVASQPER